MSKRINVTFSNEEYDAISVLSARNNQSLSDYIRGHMNEVLDTHITEDHLGIIRKIISQELEAQLKSTTNRLANLSAKTCVISATSVYMAAEIYSLIMPNSSLKTIQDFYIAARKKAVRYMQSGNDFNFGEDENV